MLTLPVVSPKAKSALKMGQGELSTKWNGCRDLVAIGLQIRLW